MRKDFFPTACLAVLLTAAFGVRPGYGAGPVDDGPPRVDRYGDPLPEGAIARLGTVRWRQPLRPGSGFARVCFSPDGKVLASTGDSGLCLWEVSTGEQVSWAPDGARIRAAVFSPDGRTLITQAFGPRGGPPIDPYQVKGLLEVWEVGTGKRLGQAEFDLAHDTSLFPVFSADGKLLVCNARGKKVHVWDARTGEHLLHVEQDVNHWDPISLSADNRLLAVIGQDRHLRLYDAAIGKERRRILWEGDRPFTGYVSPAFSPDGKLLVASTPTALRVWDTATGELKREFAECRGPAAFSADGRHLACGDRKGIRVWDTASFGEVRRFEELTEDVRGLAFSADGRRIASAQDHTVGVWDVATGQRLNRLPAHQGVIYSLAFTPSGTVLVSGSDDGSAIVWDLTTAKPRHHLPGHHRAAASVACSPDGRLLATGEGSPLGLSSSEAQIRLWSLTDGKLVRQFTGHLHDVHRLAFAPDGRWLVSAGHDARFRVWDPETGKRLYQVRGTDGTRSLAFAPDGQTLALGTSHGDLGLFRLDTGQKVRDLGTPQGDYRRRVLHVAFARDGRTVISEEREQEPRRETPPRVRVWDAETGREVRSVPIPGSHHYYSYSAVGHAVSPDGTVAATVAERREAPAVQLWDLLSGKLFAQLRGHAGSVNPLAFSPDGKLLASGSQDTSVLVWDVAEARMRHYWSELLSGTADAKAGQALAADPARAAAFLKDRLARSAEVEVTARRFVGELDHDQFAVREKASRELARLGPAVEGLLRRAQADTRSTEVRERIQAILGGLKAPDPAEAVLSPERAPMAVTLLENIDAPASRRALEELARGPAETAVTREARAALERLKKPAKDR